MLATPADDAPLTGAGLIYEPKYDGIRALAEVIPGRPRAIVRLWSRLGNDKASQFPSVVRALAALGAQLDAPVFIDGEIVALDKEDRPSGFQRLQGRIHLTGDRDVERLEREQPVAFIAFDLLIDGRDDLRGLTLVERRVRLERRLAGRLSNVLRLSEQAIGDGRELHARAEREGWEGLIVKDARSVYESGRRSPAWRKRKNLRQEEFVIGGWTEPRQARQHFGALLLGAYSGNGAARRLTYVGHTGTGFDHRELERLSNLLQARAVAQSPFAERIKTNERAHWVRPDLVVQVRFTEWTDDRKLRQPVYLGLRDDKRAAAVTLEHMGKRAIKATALPATNPVVEQLRALEDARRDGTIELPDGSRLGVTNLAKVFWPDLKLTKGDLLRYYATVAPLILPVVEDRPLVMKRFPNGIKGPAFYQQRNVQEKPPAGVRVVTIPDDLDPISEPDARRYIGGNLITLLYMTQLAAISQDPWFSRIQSPLDADSVAIDLDPGEGTPFSRVIDVAQWVRDELASLKVPSVPKTSGSRGLHVYIPLPPETSHESGMLFCQIVATIVASRHPKAATVERTVRARPKGTVYVDYLQNILGKTLATAYSARASEFAGVSTPLDWKEIVSGLDPREFTIVSAPKRFAEVGDLWAPLRTSKPANLEAVLKKYASRRE